MEPEAFHIRLGMARSSVEARLKDGGISTMEGKEPNHLIVPFDDGKTITLAFDNGKLESARFEYVGFIRDVRKAFAEQEKMLAKKRGKPSKRIAKPVLITWEDRNPNVSLVVSTERDTSYGKQGLGFLVVRYFVPAPH